MGVKEKLVRIFVDFMNFTFAFWATVSFILAGTFLVPYLHNKNLLCAGDGKNGTIIFILSFVMFFMIMYFSHSKKISLTGRLMKKSVALVASSLIFPLLFIIFYGFYPCN